MGRDAYKWKLFYPLSQRRPEAFCPLLTDSVGVPVRWHTGVGSAAHRGKSIRGTGVPKLALLAQQHTLSSSYSNADSCLLCKSNKSAIHQTFIW